MLWADWAGILEKQAGRGSRTSWAVRLEACQTDYKVRWSILQRLPESAFSWKKGPLDTAPPPLASLLPPQELDRWETWTTSLKPERAEKFICRLSPKLTLPYSRKWGHSQIYRVPTLKTEDIAPSSAGHHPAPWSSKASYHLECPLTPAGGPRAGPTCQRRVKKRGMSVAFLSMEIRLSQSFWV